MGGAHNIARQGAPLMALREVVRPWAVRCTARTTPRYGQLANLARRIGAESWLMQLLHHCSRSRKGRLLLGRPRTLRLLLASMGGRFGKLALSGVSCVAMLPPPSVQRRVARVLRELLPSMELADVEARCGEGWSAGTVVLGLLEALARCTRLLRLQPPRSSAVERVSAELPGRASADVAVEVAAVLRALLQAEGWKTVVHGVLRRAVQQTITIVHPQTTPRAKSRLMARG